MIEINGTLTDEERQKLLDWETVKRARRHANLVICGGSSSDNSSAKLIAFTIDGMSYRAEEGMTWAEWCGSSYNTRGYAVYSSIVLAPSGNSVMDASGNPVNKSATITNGRAYISYNAGGGGGAN